MKTVYIAMSADILHNGHINIIKEGAKLGHLTVGVLTDAAVVSYKRLPYLDFSLRSLIIKNIKGVDNVIPQTTLDYTENLYLLKPDYVLHGDDWKTGIQKKVRKKVINIIKEWNGQVIDIPYTEGISSTKINEQIRKLGTTPDIRLSSFKRILDSKPLVKIIESYSGLTSNIIDNFKITIDNQNFELDGMYFDHYSSSIALGKKNIEAVDFSSRLGLLNNILEASNKPIIFDYGIVNNKILALENLKTIERLALSAVVFSEDDNSEISFDFINQAYKTKLKDNFMVIVKLKYNDIDSSIRRALCYLDSGSSAIMINSSEMSPDEIIEFCNKMRKSVELPIILLENSNNFDFSENLLIDIGIRGVIFTNILLKSTQKIIKETIQSLIISKTNKQKHNLI
jgi:phosphoenolpyruvate phosphomutase / 2-hydroxyethylphosphonate cytidylyltransferase